MEPPRIRWEARPPVNLGVFRSGVEPCQLCVPGLLSFPTGSRRDQNIDFDMALDNMLQALDKHCG